ncbi:hypothetical protein SAMN05192534_1242 [Alteribacillus persepolensis]|uniref:Restriction endonuclease n=1 Tax=Alteribacillus persepolensis TaxID=568899 RepID=A0A1G8IFX3_9BACI|nr:hypothetical protein [Alteribacillus persepolensis]SDI17697.1 hypothetical protein SAMN05192534_1242 [Alteribacillus persepolensis]
MENNTVSYNQYIDRSPDWNVWTPVSEEEKPLFNELIDNVKKAIEYGTRKEKGDSLEKLMTFIYDRFESAKVIPNYNIGDNQIDHFIEFIDGLTPTFIHENIGTRIIAESKNHKDSIGVREVADLYELLRSKKSKLGIFSSYKTFSHGKTMWTLSEGKRRKLALSNERYIIGFTLRELESLTENNFYTLLKQKYWNLIDELEDDYIDEEVSIPYHERLSFSLKRLRDIGILEHSVVQDALQKIEIKYGKLTN